MTIQPGQLVAVRDPYGDWLEKRACSGVEPAYGEEPAYREPRQDFPVVYVAWPDTPDSELPFPAADVIPIGDAPGEVLSRADYIAKHSNPARERPATSRGEQDSGITHTPDSS